jgi:hypothetical protein
MYIFQLLSGLRFQFSMNQSRREVTTIILAVMFALCTKAVENAASIRESTIMYSDQPHNFPRRFDVHDKREILRENTRELEGSHNIPRAPTARRNRRLDNNQKDTSPCNNTAAMMKHHNSQLIRGPTKAVYIIQDCQLRFIPNAETFTQMGLDFGDVLAVSAEDFQKLTFGEDIPAYVYTVRSPYSRSRMSVL